MSTFFLKVVLLFAYLINNSYGQFEIPNVTLEAYTPEGFRASIPADPGIELFGFHGKVNEPINRIEYGDFTGDVKKQKDGYFTYYNPNLKLVEGDVVYYWIFVQNNKLGYRKDEQKWTVADLKSKSGTQCQTSLSKVGNRRDVCKNSVVLEDNFATNLDEEIWTLEQYLPSSPDFEFVLYKKDNDVTFIKDNRLCIKPKLREDREELTKLESIAVDLKDGCTRPAFCTNQTFLIKNPVISGRLESKLTFSYGDFEVKAKIPSGDWIFPEIYLEDPEGRKILIAYSRGNQHLTGNAGDDLGNNLLFGGPVKEFKEPRRSSKLRSYRNGAPLSETSHTYRLRWTPDLIELFLDGNRYGEVNTEYGFTGSNPSKFRLVLGVGVGGLNDFPDGYKSGENVKPWKNYARSQVVDFFDSRSSWYSSWSDEGRQLQVEYVKVTAI